MCKSYFERYKCGHLPVPKVKKCEDAKNNTGKCTGIKEADKDVNLEEDCGMCRMGGSPNDYQEYTYK